MRSTTDCAAADEPLRGSLSWNSNSFVTNAFTLNITRHVHHHLNATVPYYDLKHIESMPSLPGGYLALFFPALIPPLWRRIMDPRAAVPDVRFLREPRSQADQLLARTLKEALAIVDVKVLDHFIVARTGALSFAQRGLL